MERLAHDALSRRVGQLGEPFQTFFDPQLLKSQLQSRGFSKIEDWGAREINERYLSLHQMFNALFTIPWASFRIAFRCDWSLKLSA